MLYRSLEGSSMGSVPMMGGRAALPCNQGWCHGAVCRTRGTGAIGAGYRVDKQFFAQGFDLRCGKIGNTRWRRPEGNNHVPTKRS